MTAKPKLETVARRAGVSVATVSQVLRGTGRISESTRKKVLQAAKSLHYVTDGRAASMRSGQNREIGFLVHQLANPFNAEVISGVSDLLEDRDFLVSVLDARDDISRQNRHLQAFIRSGRAGLLWVPALATPADTFELLSAHKVPTVTFLRRAEGRDLDHVGIRNTEAIRQATHHLADLGHQRIAYLGGTDMTRVRQERIDGYTQVMAERSLGAPLVWSSTDNRSAGMEAMLELMRSHPDITAVVCNGDMVALGASLAVIRSGLRPGTDISIIGFDDIEDAAVATPALTTMAVSPYELGRRLAQTLLERIADPQLPVTISEFAASLKVRDTTGPLARDRAAAGDSTSLHDQIERSA